MRLGVGGPWYAALPQEAWPQQEEARQQILRDFQGPLGDRRWAGGGQRGGGGDANAIEMYSRAQWGEKL